MSSSIQSNGCNMNPVESRAYTIGLPIMQLDFDDDNILRLLTQTYNIAVISSTTLHF